MEVACDDPRYSWDLLNRMLTYKPHSSSDAVAYTYRADGQRTKKVDDYASPSEETLFYYDGQMGVQDTHDDGTDVTVTKYGVGARGIDVITKKVNSGSETFGYPVYDTHGNMVATLARASSNAFTVGNEKSYDVWGGDRSGSSSVDQGYVANMGHRNDAESELKYMRARYYEPSTGRFISEDVAMDGANWFVYAGNSPASYADFSGKKITNRWLFQQWGSMGHVMVLATLALAYAAKLNPDKVSKNYILGIAKASYAFGLACYGVALGAFTDADIPSFLKFLTASLAALALITAILANAGEAVKISFACIAICGMSIQAAILIAEMYSQEFNAARE